MPHFTLFMKNFYCVLDTTVIFATHCLHFSSSLENKASQENPQKLINPSHYIKVSWQKGLHGLHPLDVITPAVKILWIPR